MATVHPRIGPADHGRKMTLDEFEEADEEPGHRYELARGRLEVSDVANDSHAQIIHNVHEGLSLHRRDHPGRIHRFVQGSDVQLIIPDLESEHHPDLGVIFRGTPPNARGRVLPSLVVEVVSPGREARDRDYRAKREEYLVFGIRGYWIVDPEMRRITLLVRREAPEGEGWAERAFRDGEIVESPLLPGLAMAVSSLRIDVDPAGGAS